MSQKGRSDRHIRICLHSNNKGPAQANRSIPTRKKYLNKHHFDARQRERKEARRASHSLLPHPRTLVGIMQKNDVMWRRLKMYIIIYTRPYVSSV